MHAAQERIVIKETAATNSAKEEETDMSSDAIVRLVDRMERRSAAAAGAAALPPLDAVSEMYETYNGDVMQMYSAAATHPQGRSWFAEAASYAVASISGPVQPLTASFWNGKFASPEQQQPNVIAELARQSDPWVSSVHIKSLFAASQVADLKAYLPPAWSPAVTSLLSGHHSQGVDVFL
jgi:hypothetical protein